MKIINIKPETRKKGFDGTNFAYSKNYKEIDIETANKIKTLGKKLKKIKNHNWVV